MKDIFRNYKVYVVTLAVVLFLFITLTIANSFYNRDKNKKFMYGDYVETIKMSTNNGLKSELPYINLDTDEVEKINSEIAEMYYETISFENSQFTYKYFVNDEILSLLIITNLYSDDAKIPVENYKSYNIDYKNLNILSNEDLLKKYNLSMSDVNNMIESQFKYFYQDEINNGYINSSTCDFNCFCNLRNISFPVTDVAIILKENTLYAYKPFNMTLLSDEDALYYDEDFEYKLK